VGEGRRESGGRDRQPTGAPTGAPTGHRLTIPDAAEVLGISPEAVRSRARRGTLAAVRDGGRVYVLLSGHDRQAAQERPASRPADRDVLVDTLTGQVEYLQGQLAQERQAHGEARRIIAGLVERIPPAISPPPDERESTETASDAGERGGVPPEGERAADRPWWRRVFGG